MLFRRLISRATTAIIQSSPNKCFRFSSSSSLSLKPLSNSFDDGVEFGSAVYRHALKFQSPRIIQWCEELENTATLIGSVINNPTVINTRTGDFGVHTVLSVRTSDRSSFRVLLKMWDGMAEFACKHLKREDFILVSGRLGSYTKDDGSGNLRLFHEVKVTEFNFVTRRPCYHGHKVLESTGENGYSVDDDKNRLHLWQVFFANPFEWWDCRKRKLNPKQPDFKHKDTGEALWLKHCDPPWVKRQLQILDSKIAEMEPVGSRSRSRVTTWVYRD